MQYHEEKPMFLDELPRCCLGRQVKSTGSDVTLTFDQPKIRSKVTWPIEHVLAKVPASPHEEKSLEATRETRERMNDGMS